MTDVERVAPEELVEDAALWADESWSWANSLSKKFTRIALYIEKLEGENERLTEFCPLCPHEWRRHDPEDGMCDAPGEGSWTACPCGRDSNWMRFKVAELSRAALNRRADASTAQNTPIRGGSPDDR